MLEQLAKNLLPKEEEKRRKRKNLRESGRGRRGPIRHHQDNNDTFECPLSFERFKNFIDAIGIKLTALERDIL